MNQQTNAPDFKNFALSVFGAMKRGELTTTEDVLDFTVGYVREFQQTTGEQQPVGMQPLNADDMLFYLYDKTTGGRSKPFRLDWLINDDYDLEFESGETLPLIDFHAFRNDFEIYVEAREQPLSAAPAGEDWKEKAGQAANEIFKDHPAPDEYWYPNRAIKPFRIESFVAGAEWMQAQLQQAKQSSPAPESDAAAFADWLTENYIPGEKGKWGEWIGGTVFKEYSAKELYPKFREWQVSKATPQGDTQNLND